MRIRELTGPHLKRPRCEAEVSDGCRSWHKSRQKRGNMDADEVGKCPARARYKVGRIHMCRKHASRAALDYVVGRSKK